MQAKDGKKVRAPRSPVMLDPADGRILDRLSQALTMDKKAIVGKLLRWVERLPREMQLWAVGQLPEPLDAALRSAVRRLAEAAELERKVESERRGKG